MFIEIKDKIYVEEIQLKTALLGEEVLDKDKIEVSKDRNLKAS